MSNFNGTKLSHAVDQLKDEGDYFVVVGKRVFTRTVPGTKQYTHVLVVQLPEDDSAGVWSWHTCRDSAETMAQSDFCKDWKPVVEAINNG
jgi:hypothetical protein